MIFKIEVHAYFRAENIVAKEILLSLSNISFGNNVFKYRLQQWRLNPSPGFEELIKVLLYLLR